jgi:hypothetical protein
MKKEPPALSDHDQQLHAARQGPGASPRIGKRGASGLNKKTAAKRRRVEALKQVSSVCSLVPLERAETKNGKIMCRGRGCGLRGCH